MFASMSFICVLVKIAARRASWFRSSSSAISGRKRLRTLAAIEGSTSPSTASKNSSRFCKSFIAFPPTKVQEAWEPPAAAFLPKRALLEAVVKGVPLGAAHAAKVQLRRVVGALTGCSLALRFEGDPNATVPVDEVRVPTAHTLYENDVAHRSDVRHGAAELA
ncbi:hypothetical protein M885DRAFT_541060 [Pelagophyceae sp. CCMP2097]|nr:hypothetical protein M885DRAFT_541060 [Pelagophyceae sp. CCMP2097]